MVGRADVCRSLEGADPELVQLEAEGVASLCAAADLEGVGPDGVGAAGAGGGGPLHTDSAGSHLGHRTSPSPSCSWWGTAQPQGRL